MDFVSDSAVKRLAELRELRQIITMDNAPEFAVRLLNESAYGKGVKL